MDIQFVKNGCKDYNVIIFMVQVHFLCHYRNIILSQYLYYYQHSFQNMLISPVHIKFYNEIKYDLQNF